MNYYVVDSEEFKRVCYELKEWRNERKLDMGLQFQNLIGNCLEELTEYARAKTPEEQVDALCDICVYALNSKTPYTPWKIYESKSEFVKFVAEILNAADNGDIGGIVSNCFSKIYSLGYHPQRCLNQTLLEISSRDGKYDDKLGKFVKTPGFYDIEEAQGAFPNSKVIENSNSFDIWEGDKECLIFAKWYKADYESCKY